MIGLGVELVLLLTSLIVVVILASIVCKTRKRKNHKYAGKYLNKHLLIEI
jgi:heme/copper-type cytochrome/quinol oxidase subunit 2